MHVLDPGPNIADLPAVDAVSEALTKAARSSIDFDYITFSGNGEPTLHPEFAEIVREVARIRDMERPGVRVALLSNSTGLFREAVRDVIPLLDLPVFKLDAGSADKFIAINRPAQGVEFERILDFLILLDDIYIQSVFIDGSPGNVSAKDLNAYFERISLIRPKEVQLYSTDRPVPASSIKRVPPMELEKIAARGEKETGIRMRAFYTGKRHLRGVLELD
jgi:wyosine [tRNA(Phe)-imidazoG37] synthetase (radical SAM superfamily)